MKTKEFRVKYPRAPEKYCLEVPLFEHWTYIGDQKNWCVLTAYCNSAQFIYGEKRDPVKIIDMFKKTKHRDPGTQRIREAIRDGSRGTVPHHFNTVLYENFGEIIYEFAGDPADPMHKRAPCDVRLVPIWTYDTFAYPLRWRGSNSTVDNAAAQSQNTKHNFMKYIYDHTKSPCAGISFKCPYAVDARLHMRDFEKFFYTSGDIDHSKACLFRPIIEKLHAQIRRYPANYHARIKELYEDLQKPKYIKKCKRISCAEWKKHKHE